MGKRKHRPELRSVHFNFGEHSVHFFGGQILIDGDDGPVAQVDNPWASRSDEKPDSLTCRRWKPRAKDAATLLLNFHRRLPPFRSIKKPAKKTAPSKNGARK